MTNHGTQANNGIGKDTLYSLLSNYRRREAIKIIANKGSIDRGDLASEVASREYSKPVVELSTDERKRVHVALYQCHIPKLKDANVIEVDHNIVSPGENIEQLLPHLDRRPTYGERVKDSLCAILG